MTYPKSCFLAPGAQASSACGPFILGTLRRKIVNCIGIRNKPTKIFIGVQVMAKLCLSYY